MGEKIRNFLSTMEAAKVASVSTSAIRIWCVRYGIGKKIVGRWRVDGEKLKELIKKEEVSYGSKRSTNRSNQTFDGNRQKSKKK